MVDIQFRVTNPEHGDNPLDGGGDTFIAGYPWTDRPVALTEMQAWCLHVAIDMAGRVNSTLAFCDVYITSDPEHMAEWGIMPEHVDCVGCKAGVDQARAWMAQNPGQRLIIGQMHWAA